MNKAPYNKMSILTVIFRAKRDEAQLKKKAGRAVERNKVREKYGLKESKTDQEILESQGHLETSESKKPRGKDDASCLVMWHTRAQRLNRNAQRNPIIVDIRVYSGSIITGLPIVWKKRSQRHFFFKGTWILRLQILHWRGMFCGQASRLVYSACK